MNIYNSKKVSTHQTPTAISAPTFTCQSISKFKKLKGLEVTEKAASIPPTDMDFRLSDLQSHCMYAIPDEAAKKLLMRKANADPKLITKISLPVKRIV